MRENSHLNLNGWFCHGAGQTAEVSPGSSVRSMDWALCEVVPSLQTDKWDHPGTPVFSKADSPPCLSPTIQLITKCPSALDKTKQNYKGTPKSDFHSLPDYRFFLFNVFKLKQNQFTHLSHHPPLATPNLFSVSLSFVCFGFCLFGFLDTIYKRDHSVFVFLCLTYFT